LDLFEPVKWTSLVIGGLIGSSHCALMCGGISALCAQKEKGLLRYQLGRLVAYLILGLLVGVLGKSIYADLHESGVTKALAGLAVLGAVLLAVFHFLPKLYSRVAPKNTAFLLGFTSGLLPCGYLYGFLLIAASQGSVTGSLLTLFILWCTSLPALSVVPLAARRFPFLRHPKLRTTALFLTLMVAGVNLLQKSKDILHFSHSQGAPKEEQCYLHPSLQKPPVPLESL
jgi:uncharacterized protein